MAIYRCWAQSGVTQRANSTTYSVGDRMQPASTDTSTNHAIAKRYVWECTTGGNSGASVPSWSASYTPDSSTITDGAVVWTCRNPGFSSGSTVDWSFASIYVYYTTPRMEAGDTLLVHYTSQEAATATKQDLVAPTADNCQIISVDKDASEAYTPMGTSGYIGNTSNSQNLAFGISPVSGRKLLIKGLTIRVTASVAASLLCVGAGDDGQVEGYDLRLECTGTTSASVIRVGGLNDTRAISRLFNTTLLFSSTGQSLGLSNIVELIGVQLASTSSAITNIITNATFSDSSSTRAMLHGMDCTYANSTATLVADYGITDSLIEFHDCILPSAYVTMSGAANLNEAGLTVVLKNCKAGSETGIHAYVNALGTMVRDTAVKRTGEDFSWKINAASSTSRAAPFRTPWMWGKISTGSSVTPRLEIVRTDSASALTDVQVWCERAVQQTSGSPVKTYASSAPAYTSSGTNIATGTDTWSGEGGTAWYGNVNAGATTPTEDECLMRLCVATTTPIYVATGWET